MVEQPKTEPSEAAGGSEADGEVKVFAKASPEPDDTERTPAMDIEIKITEEKKVKGPYIMFVN